MELALPKQLHHRLLHRRSRAAWGILAVGLFMTALAWYALRMQQLDSAKQQYQLHARDITDAIVNRMRQHEQILLGTLGLFDASNNVTRNEWHSYLQRLNLEKNYPGILGVGFSQIIRPAELSAHIASIRSEGFPQYEVRPLGIRSLYTAIIYLEPFTGRNLAAFGYDMMSEATRSRAMRMAVESNSSTISGKVKLVQENRGKVQAGFLMYLPAYRANQPLNTPDERWKALKGFVYSSYRADDLMHGILGERLPWLDFSIYDGDTESDNALIYNSAEGDGSEPQLNPSRWHRSKTIQAYNHTWTIRLHSRPAFENSFESVANWVIPALGGSSSILLFVLALFLTFRREQAEEIAQKMTEEIRQNEESLRLSETRLGAILDNVLDGIITIDERGLITSFNQSAERIFGYVSAEMIGHNVKVLMPEPYHTQHDGYLNNFTSSGVKKIIGIGRQVVGKRGDGSTFPMDLAVSEMQLGGKRMFTGIVRDITERVKTERIKTEFVSTVSHELRTPLTSIRGSLALLVSGVAGELSVKAKPLIDIAHKNSERLILLVNDILDMEKIESGKMEFQICPTKIMPLLKQALEANRAYAEQYNVSLKLEGDLAGSMLSIDSNRLMQVLTNLLSNAVKFSPVGDEVILSISSDEQHSRIEVKNRGSGIPEQFHSHIFQKFAQADSSDTRKKGGTGLGLSISKAIVEQMGGNISFSSEPDVLTTFFVAFPVLHEPAAASSPSKTLVVASTPIDGKKRVLICEDEHDIAALLRLMLEQAGLAVDIAYDAGQAKEMLFQGDYAAMTLDLGLPDQNGIELIRTLRSTEKTASLPILVVSGNAAGDRKELNNEAFNIIDWITKPINQDQLITALRQALGQFSAIRPKVLHIEDDLDVSRVINTIVAEIADVENAASLAEARHKLQNHHYSLAILDLSLPDGSGMELLPLFNAATPPIPVMVFSAHEMTRQDSHKICSVLVKSRTDNAQLLATIKQLIGME